MIPEKIQEWMKEQNISFELMVFLVEMLQKYRPFFPVSPETLQWALERNSEFQIMNIEVQK